MDLAALRKLLDAEIRKAGDLVHAMSRDGFEVARKANQDPVTTADLAADASLKTGLLRPGMGWLSEETRDDPERLGRDLVWIVDPIDGTKEFVAGIPEYAVSVALVEKGLPVLGAVYNPAAGELFVGGKGMGVTLNGLPVRADRALPSLPVLLASRSEIKRGEWKPFEPVAKIQTCGSIAYKLALIAAGRADATFSLGPKNEWDIAAGVLLVQEAGGLACDQEGEPYVFNQKKTLVNGIVAATDAARAKVWEIIRSGAA